MKTEPVPVFEYIRRHSIEFKSIATERIQIDEDVSYTYQVFPMPLKTTNDGFIKVEDDPVFGNKSFINMVSSIEFQAFLNSCNYNIFQRKHRLYKIGNKMVTFPNDVIKKLMEWNEHPLSLDISIDKRFVIAVYLTISDPVDIMNSSISQHTVDFIQGICH